MRSIPTATMARILRIDPKSVRKWAREGIIKGHKVGHGWLFYEHEFSFTFEYPLILSSELAKFVGVHERTVNTWAREGVLPYVRFSNAIVRFVPGTFNVGDLAAYRRHEGRKRRRKYGSDNAAGPVA